MEELEMNLPAGVPTITAHRLSSRITVDGNTHKAVWQAIPPAWLRPTTGLEAETSMPTSMRIGYTDSHVYFAFDCEDSEIWGTYTDRDDPIYEEEVVEAFLCPTADVRRYYEVNVSPHNVLFDA